MHSNFDLNAFPGSFFDVNIGSRKDFCSYRLYGGQKSEQRFHIGAQKSDIGQFFRKSQFWSSGGFHFSLKFFFLVFIHILK